MTPLAIFIGLYGVGVIALFALSLAIYEFVTRRRMNRVPTPTPGIMVNGHMFPVDTAGCAHIPVQFLMEHQAMHMATGGFENHGGAVH